MIGRCPVHTVRTGCNAAEYIAPSHNYADLNAQFDSWDRERVDQELDRIMTGIHEQCANAAAEYR